MKALFVMPLICALASLLGFLCFSLMTVVPHSAADRFHAYELFGSGAFFTVWFCVACWTRLREKRASLPQHLKRLLLATSVFYIMAVFAFIIG
jgi:hypothetical protein